MAVRRRGRAPKSTDEVSESTQEISAVTEPSTDAAQDEEVSAENPEKSSGRRERGPRGENHGLVSAHDAENIMLANIASVEDLEKYAASEFITSNRFRNRFHDNFDKLVDAWQRAKYHCDVVIVCQDRPTDAEIEGFTACHKKIKADHEAALAKWQAGKNAAKKAAGYDEEDKAKRPKGKFTYPVPAPERQPLPRLEKPYKFFYARSNLFGTSGSVKSAMLQHRVESRLCSDFNNPYTALQFPYHAAEYMVGFLKYLCFGDVDMEDLNQAKNKGMYLRAMEYLAKSAGVPVNKSGTAKADENYRKLFRKANILVLGNKAGEPFEIPEGKTAEDFAEGKYFYNGIPFNHLSEKQWIEKYESDENEPVAKWWTSTTTRKQINDEYLNSNLKCSLRALNFPDRKPESSDKGLRSRDRGDGRSILPDTRPIWDAFDYQLGYMPYGAQKQKSLLMDKILNDEMSFAEFKNEFHDNPAAGFKIDNWDNFEENINNIKAARAKKLANQERNTEAHRVSDMKKSEHWKKLEDQNSKLRREVGELKQKLQSAQAENKKRANSAPGNHGGKKSRPMQSWASTHPNTATATMNNGWNTQPVMAAQSNQDAMNLQNQMNQMQQQMMQQQTMMNQMLSNSGLNMDPSVKPFYGN